MSSGASPAKTGSRRFNELEAYRGIAALMIVIFHAYQHTREGTGKATYVYDGKPLDVLLRNLEAGVAWFFVLSGFLVFLPFARAAIEGRPSPSPRGFVIRRAIRILPAYYTAIIVVWTWRYTGGRDRWIDLFQHLTFTHVFDDRHIFSTIGPAWSLGVEVLFYVFLAAWGPLACWYCGRLRSRTLRAIALVAPVIAMAAGSIAYKWWAFHIENLPETRFSIYFGPLAKLDTLALGMMIAVIAALAANRPLLIGIWPSVARLGGAGIIAWAFIERANDSNVGLYFTTISAIGFAPILASTVLASRGSLWERALSVGAIQFLGVISYGVYLWHEPILIELGNRSLLIRNVPSAFPANAIILASFAIAAGAISYWCIERPTMNLRHLFTAHGRIAERYKHLSSEITRTNDAAVP